VILKQAKHQNKDTARETYLRDHLKVFGEEEANKGMQREQSNLVFPLLRSPSPSEPTEHRQQDKLVRRTNGSHSTSI
jgi:hypothetical protein